MLTANEINAFLIVKIVVRFIVSRQLRSPVLVQAYWDLGDAPLCRNLKDILGVSEAISLIALGHVMAETIFRGVLMW